MSVTSDTKNPASEKSAANKRVSGVSDTLRATTSDITKFPYSLNSLQSHFLVAPEKLDKVTKRVIAPYAQIERKGAHPEEHVKAYLDINRFTLFLAETVNIDLLLYETAMVLKTVTESSGIFVYIVNHEKDELVLMHQNTRNLARHEVNIPIGEGKIAAAHVASTKQYLLLDDVQRDRRFSDGLKWIDAKVALCMPVVKPDGECYAVLELYRTFPRSYDDNILYTTVSLACWAGAAAHQAQARITLQRAAHLNVELRNLLKSYFCDEATIDTMVTDMLAVVKSFMSAMRSSFYIIDRHCGVGDPLQADMWDDGFSNEKTLMPRKRVKVNLSLEQTPAGLVARTLEAINVTDAYKDPRFTSEIDSVSGSVVRAVLASPITDKNGLIGVVSITNKDNAEPFSKSDEEIFKVFTSYCALIVHFYYVHQQNKYHKNLNLVYNDLMKLHLRPCNHDLEMLMETNGIIIAPANFRTYDFHISESNKEDMAGLISYMFIETFASEFDRTALSDFILTILKCYRANPYHNAEHAFCFTHTMFMILSTNTGLLGMEEVTALMLAGLCHDIDHPGVNNNFLSLCRHPLALMYKASMLEHHHFFLAKKIINDKQLLSILPPESQKSILDEMKYNILCTDLAVYFQLRAQLSTAISERAFDWGQVSHRKLLKGILMTTCDLSGSCKPFNISKAIAEAVYEEFYSQGDKEREMGYNPLSMMDRRRRVNQPAEQIQFLSVVVLPCLLLVQNIFPNTVMLAENCKKTQHGWHEEIELRGQKLWRHEISMYGRASIHSNENKV